MNFFEIRVPTKDVKIRSRRVAIEPAPPPNKNKNKKKQNKQTFFNIARLPNTSSYPSSSTNFSILSPLSASLSRFKKKNETEKFGNLGNSVKGMYKLKRISTFEIFSSDTSKLSVILLNCKFSNFELFDVLWKRAGLRICADGGANALFPVDSRREIPHIIKGDLDSAHIDVLDYFRDLGTEVIRDSNQDTNDFGKCLEELEKRQKERGGEPYLNVVVFGALGGRIDHEMCNLSYLYQWTKSFNTLTLISDHNLVCLLDGPGQFQVVPDPRLEGPVCGVLPVGSPCKSVTTKGLKWNMKKQILMFGGLVSSSNEIVNFENVDITCSSPVLWTTELRRSIRLFSSSL